MYGPDSESTQYYQDASSTQEDQGFTKMIYRTEKKENQHIQAILEDEDEAKPRILARILILSCIPTVAAQAKINSQLLSDRLEFHLSDQLL